MDQPPPGRRSLPYRALKWFTILYALLLALELSLRFVLGLGNPVIYRYDADCGYFPAPNQQARRFFAENDTNSFGMRSAEVPRRKSPGTLRILFVGDSVTYGTTYVDQSRIFTSILARELPERVHRPVEVLNASAGAWAPANETGYLTSRGTFDSDVVLFVLNTGDLVQPMNWPVLTLQGGYPEKKPPFALCELWLRYLKPRLFHGPAPLDAGSFSQRPDVNRDTPPVLATLDRACRFARDHGAEFRIVYSPARGADWELPDHSRAFEMLRSWAARNNVPLLDLSVDLTARPLKEVYQDGIHLRPEGDEIVAHAIERWSWPAGTQPTP
jgi:hypothetical protein